MKFAISVAVALLFASAPLALSGGALAQTVTASVYSASLNGNRMANGQVYRHSKCTLAHKTLPFGTLVRITAKNGNSVEAPVTDRGPFVAGRVYDLSGGCANGLNVSGLPKVTATILSRPAPSLQEAYAYYPKQKQRHKKHRR